MTEFEQALVNEMRKMAEKINELEKKADNNNNSEKNKDTDGIDDVKAMFKTLSEKIENISKKVDQFENDIGNISTKVSLFENDIEKFKQAHKSLAQDAIKKNKMIVDVLNKNKNLKEEITKVKEDTEKIIRHLNGILTLSRIHNQVRNGVEEELMEHNVLSDLREIKGWIQSFANGIIRARSDMELIRSIRSAVEKYDTKIGAEKIRKQWAKAEGRDTFF